MRGLPRTLRRRARTRLRDRSPHRGHGLAAEAAELVTRACHAAGHARIWATIRPTNTASIRTVLANRFVFVRNEPHATDALDYYLHSASGEH